MLYHTMLNRGPLDKNYLNVEMWLTRQNGTDVLLPMDSRSVIFCFIAKVHGQTIRFSDVPFLNEQGKSVATLLILIVL